jgi:hypothetical protein
VKRTTKAAIAGLAGCTLVLGGAQMASGSDVLKRFFDYQPLTDLWTSEANPPVPADTAFDQATASVRIMETPDGTGFKLRVDGIDTSVAGQTFGSHLHVGPCAAPSATDLDPTKGHYKHDPDGPINPENEVWFEVVPSDTGVATDNTFVSFKPVDDDGRMSIVIHAKPTDALGKAGTKEVCLPLVVTSWIPDETPPDTETP